MADHYNLPWDDFQKETFSLHLASSCLLVMEELNEPDRDDIEESRNALSRVLERPSTHWKMLSIFYSQVCTSQTIRVGNVIDNIVYIQTILAVLSVITSSHSNNTVNILYNVPKLLYSLYGNNLPTKDISRGEHSLPMYTLFSSSTVHIWYYLQPGMYICTGPVVVPKFYILVKHCYIIVLLLIFSMLYRQLLTRELSVVNTCELSTTSSWWWQLSVVPSEAVWP